MQNRTLTEQCIYLLDFTLWHIGTLCWQDKIETRPGISSSINKFDASLLSCDTEHVLCQIIPLFRVTT